MTAVRDFKITTTVETYSKRLWRFIRDRVRSESDAEDLLQDVWLQLSRVGDLDQIEQMGAWLYKVARSKIIDNQRKKRPLSMNEIDFVHNEDETLDDLMFIDGDTPETVTLRRLLWEEFRIAVNELPTEQRAVFIWNELDGLTFNEIAQRTGENPKTLISRKRYAVRKLRTRMELVRRDFQID
ncbi:MAG: sigma-70 family RNA polymerase sigma factor [bacterium]|nr:sigma-70 family RNA polymerase sigma factor [bacterium]